MKKRNRRGGRIRIFILFVLLAAVIGGGLRLAAGRRSAASEASSAVEPDGSDGESASALSEPAAAGSDGSRQENAPGTSTKSNAAEEEKGLTAQEQLPAGEDSSAAAAPAAAGTGTEEGSAVPAASDGDPGAETAASSTGSEEASSTGAEAAAPYDHNATELEEGKAYLESLDERTPAEMEYMIGEAQEEYKEEQKRAAYAQKREAYRETLAGEAVWSAFEDFVFLGDSRVVGFDLYGFLSSERVLAGSGDTIRAITDRMETIKSLSPRYIFISYGINDIGVGYWQSAQEYIEDFSQELDALQQELPDAEIYVNSILPATDEAVEYAPVWGGLPEYSEAVRQMCADKKISFIDNTSLIEEHDDLYASDGVHLQPDFYRYWAENQLLGVFDRQQGLLSF